MHEYPITQQIIKIAQETAQLNNASKVTRISLVVGELSGFIGDSIVFYFDFLSEGTLCEGAQQDDLVFLSPDLSVCCRGKRKQVACFKTPYSLKKPFAY